MFALLVGLFQPVIWAQAAVTLISFSAEADETSTRIIISWATGSELDSSGFYVLRSTQRSGTYTRLNTNQVPASGEVVGAEYTFFDDNVVDCTVYYYRLEAIDNSGNSLIYERDPTTNDFVTANLDRTGNCVLLPTATSTSTSTTGPTATRTFTPTPTPTSTNTPVGFTASPSPSPTLTRTATPTPLATLTPTPLPSSTPVPLPSLTPTLPTAAVGQITATNIPTPTTTLEPLPTMQLVFPAAPTDEKVTPGVTVIVITANHPQLIAESPAEISSQLLLLVGVVVVLWIGLMVFLVIFLKKSSQ